MKTLVINTLASWVATIRSFVDGDIFRESNIDLSMGDVADRVGYLKAQVDASGKLAGNNTWTGDNIFDTGTGPAKIFRITGDWDAEIFSPLKAQTADFAEQVTFQDRAVVNGVLELANVLEFTSNATLADANVAITTLVARVPATGNNRVYTLPAGSAGQLCFVVRARAADAHTITIQDPSGSVTQGVMPASAASWMVLCANSSTSWRPLAWHSNVTSILATV
jgi:hypothetical protein